MQTAHSVFGGNLGDAVPARAMIAIGGDQVDHDAVGIPEGEHLVLVAGPRRVRVDPEVGEPLLPPTQRRARHAERRRGRHAGALPTRLETRPRKEGEQAGRGAPLVTVIEVIGLRGVEVHRLLDQPQTERAGVEVDVGLRVCGDGGHVV